MTRAASRGLGSVAVALLGLSVSISIGSAFAADESGLTVADLAAYRAALSEPGAAPSGSGSRSERPQAVGFRELWDHPRTYQGRRVQVQGRLVRQFRQGAVGTFPPLVEAWIFSPAGDPFCLVFPAAAGSPKMKKADPESQVQFTGTFLKLLEYPARDGPRLAPLIVGPAPLGTVVPAGGRAAGPGLSTDTSPTQRWLEGTIALTLALLVAMVLVFQHLRRPVRLLRLDSVVEPAPRFDDAPTPSRSDEAEADAEEEGRDSCPT
jgi:hypothetical protein